MCPWRDAGFDRRQPPGRGVASPPLVQPTGGLHVHVLSLNRHGRIDLSELITHRFRLDEIEEAYDLFAHQRDGVVKVAITP